MFFRIILFIFCCFSISNSTQSKLYKTVVLIPCGQKSRTIGDYYASSLNIAFCTALAESLQKKDSFLLVSIIKEPPFVQLNTFALAEEINKKNPNFVMYIGLYAQPEEVPCVHFFCYDNENAFIQRQTQSSLPTLTKVEHAHMHNSKKSFEAALRAEKQIHEYAVKGLYNSFSVTKIPFLPLKGIVAPAFAWEIGIEKPYDWKRLVEDITNACIAALDA